MQVSAENDVINLQPRLTRLEMGAESQGFSPRAGA